MNDIVIEQVRAREIINGRGIPTVEVEVTTNRGICGTASAPGGVSTAAHEAIELRDGGSRYMGKGVAKAVANIRDRIAPHLAGRVVTEQQEIDHALIELDGTPNKSNLGGNALTAVSLAVAKAAALSLNLPVYRYLGGAKACSIPVMCPNMLSGSSTAGNDLDFEDYLLVPYGFSQICEAIRAGVEVFHTLHGMLTARFGLIPQITALAPPLQTNEEALDILLEAITKAGYEGKIGIGIDVAAGLLYDETKAVYKLRRGEMTREELIAYYAELTRRYPILFWEDGLYEEDFQGFSLLTQKVSTIVVGDDLFATNKERLLRGARGGSANAILLKVNQAGTVSEALETAETAKNCGYAIVSSVRSRETDDPVQADLAVAVGAKLMKVGCPLRGEMVTKYNRLMKIEEDLGGHGHFRGIEFQREA